MTAILNFNLVTAKCSQVNFRKSHKIWWVFFSLNALNLSANIVHSLRHKRYAKHPVHYDTGIQPTPVGKVDWWPAAICIRNRAHSSYPTLNLAKQTYLRGERALSWATDCQKTRPQVVGAPTFCKTKMTLNPFPPRVNFGVM